MTGGTLYMEIVYNLNYNIKYYGQVNAKKQPHGPGKLYTGAPPGSNVFNGNFENGIAINGVVPGLIWGSTPVVFLSGGFIHEGRQNYLSRSKNSSTGLDEPVKPKFTRLEIGKPC